MYFMKVLISFVWIALKVECIPSIIRVGGLFTAEQEEQELAFRFAVDKINDDKLLLPESTLIAQVERVDSVDSFLAQQKVCGLLRNGMVAIFGPQDDMSSLHVQSICENYDIPHIKARLDHDWHRSDLMINLYPHPHQLTKVFMDLIKAWDWKSFAIVYDINDGVVHLKDFFDASLNHSWSIQLFQLREGIPYRDVLWEVKRTNQLNIIFHVKRENLIQTFNDAQQVGLMTEKHHFLITSLDLLTLDLEDYRYSRTNITALRLYNENSFDFQSLVAQWPIYAARLNQRHLMIPPQDFIAESVLIYDAVKVLVMALKELYSFNIQQISCDEEVPWAHGASVINYMRQVQTEGISHVIKFDDSGLRSTFIFDIISITEDGFDVVGTWSSDKVGRIQRTDAWKRHYSKSKLDVDVLRIITVLSKPFTMITISNKPMTGNARYEGYVIDLAKELAKELHFEFEIILSKGYGKLDDNTGKWDGMMGAVIDGEADIAIADLAVNSQRERYVDFTLPFMSTGISILYKKPMTKEVSLWSFLSPFSITVWVYMLGTFGGVSVLLFLTGRFSPYEWGSTHPCRQDDKVLENGLNIRNSFWCTIGSLMQQGSDIAPKAMSTRVIIAIWYFFTLIIVSSYTANLAAFLTVEVIPWPFHNVEELAAQTKIKYGCYPDGGTHSFFKKSNISTYKKIAQFMEKNPHLLMSSSKAIEKIENDNGLYAYFMEAAPIEYHTERDCNLTQVGPLLDNKGYAIAAQNGSKLRNPLSQAILKLQETGVLYALKERWWKQKGGGQCTLKPSTAPPELGLKNLGGVFLVLLFGSLMAVLMAICEFLYKIKKENKDSYMSELIEDFKFAMKCSESSKPTRSKSQKSLTGSRSFVGSKTGSTPRLNSQLSGVYY